MQILDGKVASKEIREELYGVVQRRKDKNQKLPHLAAILVGDDSASITYVNAKIKACKEIGFKNTLIHLKDNVTETQLLDLVNQLNNNPEIDGFIVQLPLPTHIDEKKIILAIDPKKDVDGFHPTNLGKMMLNLPCFLPATPAGILKLIKKYNIETEGKHCVVIGRSHIVGAPISVLMSRNSIPGNATVTLAHSKTKNLKELTLQADIIITAVGKPRFLTADMVKKGIVVIDVGMNRIDDATRKSGYRLMGDADFENVSQKASFITPVPGGVGPMTIVSLLTNTLKAMLLNGK